MIIRIRFREDDAGVWFQFGLMHKTKPHAFKYTNKTKVQDKTPINTVLIWLESYL